MAKKKDEKDVLVVRDEKTGEISVVAGLNADGTPKRTPAKAENAQSFVYDPGLRSRRNIRITEHGDLNEIYRRTYNDTTLYKPIKGNWYIELDHSI